MNTNLLSVKFLSILVLTLTMLCFASSALAKKGGNGGGKPGDDDPGEPVCTGAEPKEPEIAFLTGMDTSGDVHTQDLYLSSISGCDQYLLLEDAVQKLPDGSPSEGPGEYLFNITDLRLDIEGDMGVVTWRDVSIDPIPQIALKFVIDEFDNVIPDLSGNYVIHVAGEGYGVRGADVRINDLGQIELVMIERAPDDSNWRVSYVNTDPVSGSYLVISTGNCQALDSYGKCFNPVYSRTTWNEDGSKIYFDSGQFADYDRMAITGMQRIGGLWQPPEVLMTYTGSLRVIGVRSDGLLAYERLEYDTKRNGRRSNYRWVTAYVENPDVCTITECIPSDGNEMAADGNKYARDWTRNGGMLFIETGPGNQRNLREYSNPFSGEVGLLNIHDVDRDQRDTTY